MTDTTLFQVHLVILDWEGTLGDTLGQILNCIKTEASRLHFGEVDEDLARRSVDLGLVNATKKIFPHLSVSQQSQLLDAVQQAMLARHHEDFLLKGADAFVRHLYQQKIPLAIATNRGPQSLKRALAATGLTEYITSTKTSAETAPKPCPQMIEEILNGFSLKAQDAVMIGDSEHDMMMAQSIGMPAIGVNFYHQDNAPLLRAGALAVFDDFQKLSDYLNPFLHAPDFNSNSK